MATSEFNLTFTRGGERAKSGGSCDKNDSHPWLSLPLPSPLQGSDLSLCTPSQLRTRAKEKARSSTAG